MNLHNYLPVCLLEEDLINLLLIIFKNILLTWIFLCYQNNFLLEIIFVWPTSFHKHIFECKINSLLKLHKLHRPTITYNLPHRPQPILKDQKYY